MLIRQAKPTDFGHVETFVWQAIFPAFDREGLTDAQRAENDAMVEGARDQVLAALADRDTAVFVAIDPKSRNLVGYLIADAAPRAYAEIVTLIVKRAWWGKGVAASLLAEATNFIGRDRAISLAVRHFNARAIAFFAKHDFEDTGETTGDHAIPRTLLLREAYEDLTPLTPQAMEDKDKTWNDDFPTGADEPVPVYEALPDYNLAVDETPLFQTGTNALATEPLGDFDTGNTTLTENQLTELEAFIARARAKKGTPAPREERTMQPVKSAPARPTSPEQSTVGDDFGFSLTDDSAPRKPFRKRDIPFEVDYGDGPVAQPSTTGGISGPDPVSTPATAEGKTLGTASGPSFEFAFDDKAAPLPEPASLTTPVSSPASTPAPAPVATAVADPAPGKDAANGTPRPKPKTKHCPDCLTELPTAARFCFRCGYPQPEEDAAPAPAVGQQAPEEALALPELPDAAEETLELPDLSPPEKPTADNSVAAPLTERAAKTEGEMKTPPSAAQRKQAAGKPSTHRYTPAELKQRFREHMQERVTAYFGTKRVKKYDEVLERDTAFQQLRDGSLNNLAHWLNSGDRTVGAAEQRLNDTLADLTEYFIVETAGELSKGVLPQRLLRYQSVDWETVDLFQLVMDYLDFDKERELVYTDFVSMPARALRNATKSFLQAGKDERIFLICDQSLISQAKNGFAVTDSGVYWKNVLQPAGVTMFTTLESLSLDQGHLEIDGQFFNAGSTLNLKMAVLLDKLRRMG